ncbi:MAG: ASPIC/UnbV domain-containing protein [Pirellulaceae bacterium]
MLRYRQGWKALNRLLHEDRSFSGREKNCAFLNMRNGQFASISSVSGLDFADDGRAIALCDWDFDGRMDLWMTARTAPRIRLLRNQETASKGNFIAIRLHGNGRDTNRNAVGARVEVVLRPNADGSSPKLIKTLHAGDAFLSQSSNWLHFGLSDAETIEKILVRWPTLKQANAVQTVTDCQVNRFYDIRQDQTAAERWQPPQNRLPLDSQEQQVRETTQTARIVLPSRLPLPKWTLRPGFGSNLSNPSTLSGPTLLNVWSTTCVPCLHELNEWTSHAAEFQQQRLNVLAINADAVHGDDNLQHAQDLMERMKFPFAWAVAEPESLQLIDYFQRAVMDRWSALPIPCSFLLDSQGNVAVIYKGPVTRQQLWDDMQLLEKPAEQIRQAAVPFAGRWRLGVAPLEPTSVTSQMIDHNDIAAAIAYLGEFVRSQANSDPQKLADVLFVQAVLLDSQGDSAAALNALRQASEYNPEDFRPRLELARRLEVAGQLPQAQQEWVAACKINADNLDALQGLALNLLKQQKYKAAAQLLERIRTKNPVDPNVHFRLATTYGKLGESQRAAAAYQRTLELDPKQILAANNLAWILATDQDDSLRNGQRAVELAELVCQATRFREPQFLDTLSVAYAENGDFEKAIQTVRQMMQQMEASGPVADDVARPLEDRLRLFEQQQPFRE